MSSDTAELSGPDFGRGVPLSQIRDGGMLAGHADGKPVLLARRGGRVFAVGAACTHYGGPLADGILVGDTIRCPWHHACFDLHTGEAVRAPALSPITRLAVEHRGESVFVGHELPEPPRRRSRTAALSSVVIVGAGAAADAAADMLRREGYDGPVTMIGAERDAPYDRPNLSKDYLAGTAEEEWIPLRPPSFYADRDIRLLLGDAVVAIDPREMRVALESGASHDCDALLLATGASPVRLPKAVENGAQVHYLRSLADSRAIIRAAADARRALVIGASFIGLEVAASLRARGLDVHVIAPELHPLERVMGRELSEYVVRLHEAHGVVFHLGASARILDERGATLDGGERVAADLIVAGIGVRPNDELAKAAGLAVDHGIAVNEFLETSVPHVFAAGDVARFPDTRTGESIRIEHWVVAQRQGQAAARNMLGARERYASAPFFWSRHYDASISYVGHATSWDTIETTGDPDRAGATFTFLRGGRPLAVATVGRDRASLEAEVAMEREQPLTASGSGG